MNSACSCSSQPPPCCHHHSTTAILSLPFIPPFGHRHPSCPRRIIFPAPTAAQILVAGEERGACLTWCLLHRARADAKTLFIYAGVTHSLSVQRSTAASGMYHQTPCFPKRTVQIVRSHSRSQIRGAKAFWGAIRWCTTAAHLDIGDYVRRLCGRCLDALTTLI